MKNANNPPASFVVTPSGRLQTSGYRLQEKKQWPAVAKLPSFLLRLKPEV